MRSGGVLWALAAVVAACGTEPNPDVTGDWSLTASYSGGGLSCTVLAKLTLEKSGISWAGSFAEEAVECSNNGTPLMVAPDTSSVVAAVEGHRVSFTPQPQGVPGESPCTFFHYEGLVSGDELSGTVQTSSSFCQGTSVAMSGTWRAQRS